MNEWKQPHGRAEWTHPRRASKETISYLSQVEPVIDQYAQDDHSYGGGGNDEDEDEDEGIGREQMMDNILEELKHQTASIMEDRQGSVVAEKIVRRLTHVQLRTMLGRCRGYMLSLANNRYSSHVLQTLLSVSGQVVEAELSEGAEDDDGNAVRCNGEREDESSNKDGEVGSMRDIILSLVSELSGAWAELLADISGSHVGRGFLQVLGGLPILSEKRGRQSRHAHSIGTAVSSSKLGGGPGDAATTTATSNVDPEALEKWSTPYKHRVPPSFVTALGAVTSELGALQASELQTLVCGTFGCPPLVMLLRVHSNLATTTSDPVSSPSPTMVMPHLEQESAAMRIVMKLLDWDNEERSAQVVYAISGENTASHFLEAVLWLSPRKFFEELYHRCFESKLLEFCEHGVSNFLIQAALQRVDDKALAESMVEAISDNASELLKARRTGVLWRAAQACVRLRLKPKTQTKLLGDIARAVQAGHTGVPPPRSKRNSGDENDPAAGVKREDDQLPASTTDIFTAARSWVPALLSPRLPGEGGLDRLFLNVPGARVVQNAMLFDVPVAAPVLKAVAALPENVLAAIARDNLGSRCLLDPILDAAGTRGAVGSRGKNKPAEDARRAILRAFRGHLVAMACDRVAWHILLKCFRGVDMKEKRAMAEELASGGEQARSRMSGYPSGRSVLTECMVERFSRSPHEWEEAFKNRDNRAKMLTEIFAVGSSTSGKSANKADQGKGVAGVENGAVGVDTGGKAVGLAPSPLESHADDVVNDAGKVKEKRRRQRGRGKRGKSTAAATATATATASAGGADSTSSADVKAGGGREDIALGGDNGGVTESGDKPTAVKGAKGSKKAQGGGGLAAESDVTVGDDTSGLRKKGREAKEGSLEEEEREGGGATTAKVPKKKKRKRQGEDRGVQEDASTGGVEGAIGAAAAGESGSEGKNQTAAAKTSPSSAAAAEGPGPLPMAKKKKDKKKKHKGDGALDDGPERRKGRTGDPLDTAAAKEVSVAAAGDSAPGGGDLKDGEEGRKRKSKKKSKSPTEDSMWMAVETPTRKRKGDGVSPVKAGNAVVSSGKKRKGGFRLF